MNEPPQASYQGLQLARDNVMEQIRFCDEKAGSCLAAVSVFGGILAIAVTLATSLGRPSAVTIGLAASSAVALLLAVGCVFYVLWPRIPRELGTEVWLEDQVAIYAATNESGYRQAFIHTTLLTSIWRRKAGGVQGSLVSLGVAMVCGVGAAAVFAA